jgi:hypothetical protein
MNLNLSRLALLAGLVAPSITMAVTTGGAQASAGAASPAAHAPIVTIEGGAVRGQTIGSGFVFRGLPYAAPPTGHLR